MQYLYKSIEVNFKYSTFLHFLNNIHYFKDHVELRLLRTYFDFS